MKYSKEVIVTVLVLLSGGLGYFMADTKHQGQTSIISRQQYDKGFEAGRIKAQDEAPKTYLAEYKNLQQEHEALADDYNRLYDAAINYVSAPRGPITCTSNTYGSVLPTTMTTCY